MKTKYAFMGFIVTLIKKPYGIVILINNGFQTIEMMGVWQTHKRAAWAARSYCLHNYFDETAYE